MKLALVGYGKMGRLIASLAPEYGLEVALTVDVGDRADYRGIDVAIEFTAPRAARANLLELAAARVPAVCGTTGWYEHLSEVRAAFEANGAGFVYGPNFSIGVNVFSRVVAEAARLLATRPEYEAWAWEIHHSAKKDAPSGTLLKLVDDMRAAGYTLPVDTSSNRAGRIPGTHEIGFDSAADTITLRHTARSREGFARGALYAARWLAEGGRGCHEFSEILFK
jgi:4-hydroxy-tetrahydrodipicolinate reductase